ncbi:pentatricopeptide repeat-containing 1, mitochondrial [Pelobates cultripes]|nr:pentatricopeptide repeat-containing 1, mitochondrial [Pelobates cultripes]
MRLLQFVTRCMSHHFQVPRCVCQAVLLHRTIYQTHICDFSTNWHGSFLFTTKYYCTSTHTQHSAPRRKRIHTFESDNSTSDAQDSTEDDFGTLSQKYSSRAVFKKTSPDLQNLRHAEDEIEEKETLPLQKVSRRNTPYWYFLQCKSKIKEGKLAEALELFETNMLQEERLQPEESNYTILIGGCGRAGYVKKAFSLYSDMKKRDLKPTDATYTALFNACAESPWKDSGLQHAMKLHQELKNKNIELNMITYRSLMKVCALCGGLHSSLEIFKEMVQKGHIVITDTFNVLLMGCIEDKTVGFRYSLQVWRLMLSLGLKPNINTYNLLIRAIKECGIGDPKVAYDILLSPSEHALPKKKSMFGKHKQANKVPTVGVITEHEVEMLKQQLVLESTARLKQSSLSAIDVKSAQKPAMIKSISSQVTKEVEPFNSDTVLIDAQQQPPNLLNPVVEKHMVVSLGNVLEPSDRLALVGDMEGILQKMKEDQVTPTIKTLTLLADVTKPGSQSESSLLNIMDLLNIKVDVTFFNTLVKKRSKMLNLASAKELLPVLVQKGIAPNIQTFCHLASACHKREDGLQLLEDMVNIGVLPNNYIYSTLIQVALKRLDYVYLTDIIRDMKVRNVAPNEVVIRQLEFAAQYPPKFDRYQGKNVFLEKIDGFRGYYNRWLGWMAAEETPHPWEKYKTKRKLKEHLPSDMD